MTPFRCLLSRKLESAGKEKIAIHNVGLSVLAVALIKAKVLFWYKIIEPDLFMGCGLWRFLEKTAGSVSASPFLRGSWPSSEFLLMGNELLCRSKIFAWVNGPSSRAFNSDLAWKYGMLLQRVISMHVTWAWSRKELCVWCVRWDWAEAKVCMSLDFQFSALALVIYSLLKSCVRCIRCLFWFWAWPVIFKDSAHRILQGGPMHSSALPWLNAEVRGQQEPEVPANPPHARARWALCLRVMKTNGVF